MINKFSIPVELTDNKIINFYELKNKHLFNLLKLIQNQNLNTTVKYYDTILSDLICEKNNFEQLNFIDKFISLLTLRSICISPDIEFEIKKENKITKKIQLYNIIECLKNISFSKKIKLKKDFFIIFSLPRKLYYNSIDDIFEDCIKTIIFNNNTIEIKQFSTQEKKDIYNTLPGNILTEAKKYFYELEDILQKNILIKKDELIEIDNINLSILKNTCMGVLNSIFKDSLFNFYNLMYVFTNKLHISLTEYFNLTPAESNLMLSFYLKEQEEAKKTSESNKIPIVK